MSHSKPVKLTVAQAESMTEKELMKLIDETPDSVRMLTLKAVKKLSNETVDYLTRRHNDIAGWLIPIK